MQPLVDVIIPGALAPGESLAQALDRHPERDVLIALEAIDDDRIARLGACARREHAVATLSVFSDSGIAAYEAARSDERWDEVFASENAGIAIELPCALPPAIYLTRAALRECGPPASASPADLVEFCMRATDAGLRHLLCADVYVATGSAGKEAAKGLNEAIGVHAQLSAEWEDFLQRAPTTPLRRRVDIARLRTSARPRVLFLTHHWGGGVELHVRDLAQILADDAEVLVLRPARSGTVHLQWLREGEGFEAWFDVATQWNDCRELLRSLGIARIHIHHVHGLPRAALSLAAELGVPFDITLHDHYAMCPQYHLADANGRYCGEPDEAGCNRCIAGRPSQWGDDIGEWRGLFRETLAHAARVIAPSTDIATRMQRYFPGVHPHVLPHPDLRAHVREIYKVVLLGGLSAIKGMDLFEACVRDACARSLPLHFHVLGHISRPLEVPKDAPVAVLGSYDDARLAMLVAIERPDAFLFLSQVPETYGYTLSVAMQSGKPIVATQLGAFMERLRAYPAAALVPHDATARGVNDALLRLLRGRGEASAVRPVAITAQRA